MNLRDTLKINEEGHLEIGGADTVDLCKKFGTPLYALDYAYIKKTALSFADTIKRKYGDGAVAYASKAFSATALYKLFSGLGLYSDVVSKGEIYTALKGGMPADSLVMHGNNKQEYEIDYAVSEGVGYIVIDGMDEPGIIDAIAKKYDKLQKVLVRLNPGVEAHTHHFTQTAREDSKFGFSIKSGAADELIKSLFSYKNLIFSGLHCHIGSQIFDREAFGLANAVMTDYIKKLRDSYGITVDVLNLGGGFGVHYTDKDPLYTAEDYAGYVDFIAETLTANLLKKDIKKPFLIIEPGRSLIAEAGITLYTVGTVKDIKGIKKYYAIDGGMFENPRYALYRSEYSAIIANKAREEFSETVTLTGKCCESGDMIAEGIKLQKAQRGDVVAVFSTGAYNYSMSSHYNGNLTPPAVMIKDGEADYIIKPESCEDLIRNNNIPDFLN
ncbi:MAG: diaminopimelate decarboxylase [Clostridiales bacterium]|jgi:diaminopimelate decarboxylase|nr:diaminopimelate decarboxylase [Clostridiales bacterium]